MVSSPGKAEVLVNPKWHMQQEGTWGVGTRAVSRLGYPTFSQSQQQSKNRSGRTVITVHLVPHKGLSWLKSLFAWALVDLWYWPPTLMAFVCENHFKAFNEPIFSLCGTLLCGRKSTLELEEYAKKYHLCGLHMVYVMRLSRRRRWLFQDPMTLTLATYSIAQNKNDLFNMCSNWQLP
jgi:hypothetical protein